VDLGVWTYWPAVACSGNYVYIDQNNLTASMWLPGQLGKKDANYNTEVYMQVSADNGATWGPLLNISNAVGRSEDASIIASGSGIYLAWNDGRDDVSVLQHLQTYYRHSHDNGGTWGPETAITHTPQLGYSPHISAIGNQIIVSFAEHTSNVATRVSNDAGLTWTPPLQNNATVITPIFSGYQTTTSDLLGNSYVAYTSANHTYYHVSADGGLTWTAPLILSATPSGFPWLASQGNIIHALFSLPNAGGSSFFYTNTSSTLSPTSSSSLVPQSTVSVSTIATPATPVASQPQVTSPQPTVPAVGNSSPIRILLSCVMVSFTLAIIS